MKVYYDYQIFISQKYGGVSRYFYELINRLEQTDSFKANIGCKHNVNYYFAERLGSCHKELSYKEFKIWSFINHFFALNDLKKDYDIFHPTFNDPYFIGKHKGKLVITVHDMIHEIYCDKYPENLSKKDIEIKKACIYAADHIIAISENTKKDIVHFYPDIDEEKISVIYHGMDNKTGSVEYNDSLPKRFVLFVGQRRNYKNYENFMKAMRAIMESDSDLHIILAGAGPLTANEKELTSGFEERVLQYSCDDTLLSQLYSQALAFVFPSMYEGFGIPTLEAFSHGCPAIISNTSSMPEVGGEAAEYFNPEDSSEIADAIRKVIYDDKLRNSMKELGYKQLQKFSWDITASKTLDVYKKVLM